VPIREPALPGPDLDTAARAAAHAAAAITGEDFSDVLAKGRMRWQLVHDGSGNYYDKQTFSVDPDDDGMPPLF
jgi:hypothetical protein